LGKIIYQKQNLDGFFDLSRHLDLGGTKPQEVSIEIEFSDDDLENIKIIKDHLSDLAQIEKDLSGEQISEIDSIFGPILSSTTQENVKSNRKQKFTFNAPKLDLNSGESQFNSYTNEQKI
jgi:hypothetical protein